MEKLTPEELRNISLKAVDDYLFRNATERITFFDLQVDVYTTEGAYAKQLLLDYSLVRPLGTDRKSHSVTIRILQDKISN